MQLKFIIAVSFLCGQLCHVQGDEDDTARNAVSLLPKAQADFSNWMSLLPDDSRIFSLSIPGTHDSAATKILVLDAERRVTCQTMDIEEQLKGGVRLLDIRVYYSLTLTQFRLCHGVMDMDMTISDVLGTITRFLEEHPRETVLLLLKEDGTRDTLNAFGHKLLSLLQHSKHSRFFYLSHLMHCPPNGPETKQPTADQAGNAEEPRTGKNGSEYDPITGPLLGEVRGKIVIYSTFDGCYPIQYHKISISQDLYQLTEEAGLDAKWEAIYMQQKLQADAICPSPDNDASETRGSVEVSTGRTQSTRNKEAGQGKPANKTEVGRSGDERSMRYHTNIVGHKMLCPLFNFISASGPRHSPYHVASGSAVWGSHSSEGLNARLAAALKMDEYPFNVSVGSVLLDFPGPSVLGEIVAQNFHKGSREYRAIQVNRTKR